MNLFLIFAAGLASVLSPCVLPVLPIVVTGTAEDHRLRPLFIVAGLSLTFVAMGMLSSLFGSLIAGAMFYVEKIAAVIIILFGLLMLFNINPFKHISFLSRTGVSSRGLGGGLILGMTLGIIWIPCIGPMLSSVLAVVALKGQVLGGAFLLFVYALGFAVPMLAAGFASQFFRTRFRNLVKVPYLVNGVSGLILLLFGGFILWRGMVGFGGL